MDGADSIDVFKVLQDASVRNRAKENATGVNEEEEPLQPPATIPRSGSTASASGSVGWV